MTKRFQIDDDGDISEFDSNGKWVDCWMYANGKHWDNLCNELNHLNDENEQLKKENEQLKAILNDFINILNRLQSNPTDKQTLGVARDMLQNMGKELEE